MIKECPVTECGSMCTGCDTCGAEENKINTDCADCNCCVLSTRRYYDQIQEKKRDYMVVTKKVTKKRAGTTKKPAVRRNVIVHSDDFVPMTPAQLKRLYDDEDRMGERAGNTEERCMKHIGDLVNKNLNSSARMARLNKLWEDTEAQINKMINKAGIACGKVKGAHTGQKCAEIQVASLTAQINVYYDAMKKADAIVK